MRKILAAILLMTGAGAPTLAVAQPTDAVRLAPGVYTTPEISRQCQQYAANRVGLSGAGDRSRLTVFVACVRRLTRDQSGPPAAAYAPPPAGPLVSAPVALPAYGGDWYGFQCTTDEGYGRRGNCSTF